MANTHVDVPACIAQRVPTRERDASHASAIASHVHADSIYIATVGLGECPTLPHSPDTVLAGQRLRRRLWA